MPPFLDVSTPAVAVRALARVPAQLSNPARDRGDLARRGLGPRGRASSDGWAASELKLRARGRVRGSHGGFLFHQVAQESPRLSRAAQLKFVGFEK